MTSDKITKIWDEERERIKESDKDETEELESGSLEGRIEELEKKYDRYSRATESNSGHGWKLVTENTRKELVELKQRKLQEIAEEHDSLDRSSYIGAMKDKERLNNEFHELEGEIEELQK